MVNWCYQVGVIYLDYRSGDPFFPNHVYWYPFNRHTYSSNTNVIRMRRIMYQITIESALNGCWDLWYWHVIDNNIHMSQWDQGMVRRLYPNKPMGFSTNDGCVKRTWMSNMFYWRLWNVIYRHTLTKFNPFRRCPWSTSTYKGNGWQKERIKLGISSERHHIYIRTPSTRVMSL